jgi:2,4-dienoyl-CoA reductase-like NADH-dependent reductase (Old Yellow Enzyme family)
LTHLLISKEKLNPYKVGRHEHDTPIFARIDIDDHSNFKNFLAIAHPSATAIIYKENSKIHHSRWDEIFLQDVVEQHVAFAKRLVSYGISRLVIAADADGVLQKFLSPRFNSDHVNVRMKPLLEIFLALKDLVEHVAVLLTVEELAPAGIDPMDGVQIAQALQNVGLKEIIVASGTKDFMPLYDRRTTGSKGQNNINFSSNEPALASAWWLLENTHLKIFCLAFIDEPDKALALAQIMGLAGLIEKAQ